MNDFSWWVIGNGFVIGGSLMGNLVSCNRSGIVNIGYGCDNLFLCVGIWNLNICFFKVIMV